MASAPTTHFEARSNDREQVRHALLRARRMYFEEPLVSLAEAVSSYETGRRLRDDAICARARALQGLVTVHRGDMRGGLELALDAERFSERCSDRAAEAEVAALRAQVSFFSGAHAEAVSHADRAIRLSDETGDALLRIYVRRATCMVFGNLGVSDWRQRLDELLALSLAHGDAWDEAIARNDIACHLQERGELAGAEYEIGRALEAVDDLASKSSFALALLHSTRADIRLLGDRPGEAVADAERAIALLTADEEPNPYVLGATVRAEVQALMALGQVDSARKAGENALAWLGDRVPQTRSLILTTLANALRHAGRLEEAYDALERAAEVERQAFRELSALQLRLERATLEIDAARRESEALAAHNRRLTGANAELERRASQLEGLQQQLRNQAERDWLTGLHNRRYLAAELERLGQERRAVPVSVAVLDLDHFKEVNDRFGHDAGDQVLVRVARLLVQTLRSSDTVVRSGGEEFILVMPATDLHAAAACCERICEAIRGEPWTEVAPGLALTASIGVACTAEPHELDALRGHADALLYDAKRAGRDRVVSVARSPAS